MDVKLTKLILKCIVIVVLSIIMLPFLSLLISHLATGLLCELGRIGALIMLFLTSVLGPMISAILVIGIIGGLWIGEKKQIGFINASVLASIELVIVTSISKHGTWFDIPGLIILAGIPAIIFSGGLTYSKIHNWKQAKMAEQGS